MHHATEEFHRCHLPYVSNLADLCTKVMPGGSKRDFFISPSWVDWLMISEYPRRRCGLKVPLLHVQHTT
jgi:hypothetical protein